MKFDIDQLSEAELIDLNNRIVARLRFLQQMRAHVEMLEFKFGDRVSFLPPGQGPVEGMLTRYNKKTVTVVTDEGRQLERLPCPPQQGCVSEEQGQRRLQCGPAEQALRCDPSAPRAYGQESGTVGHQG